MIVNVHYEINFKIALAIGFEKTGKLAFTYDAEVILFLLDMISCKMSLLRHWQLDYSWTSFLSFSSYLTHCSRFSVVLSDSLSQQAADVIAPENETSIHLCNCYN